MFIDNMNKSELKAFFRECILSVLNEEKEFLKVKLKDSNSGLATIKDVCSYFKVSRPTVYNWIKRGAVYPIKQGKGVRFKLAEIEETMRIHPYAFGRGRDYEYRDQLLPEAKRDMNRFYRINNRLYEKKQVDDNDLVFYQEFAKANNLKTYLD